MSTKEAVTIASRALAIYFLAWLLYDVTNLPSALHHYLHYQTEAGSLGMTDYLAYMRTTYGLSLWFLLLRMVGLFLAVQWFYRCGPRLQTYFLESSDEEPTTP